MKKAKISDLIADSLNFNLGNEYGNSLIEKSISKNGLGRGVLIDKNNRIIAGNKTVENAGALGFENIIIVETTGNELVVTKRTDIDLDSKQGRELALSDNATSKANLTWDYGNLNVEFGELELKEWGVDLKFNDFNNNDEVDYTDLISNKNKEIELDENEKFTITLNFTSEDYFKVKDALSHRGLTAEEVLFEALNV